MAFLTKEYRQKYAPGQARDQAGRFASGGGSFAGTSPKAREVQARIGPSTGRAHTEHDETDRRFGPIHLSTTTAHATYTDPDGETWPMKVTVDHVQPKTVGFSPRLNVRVEVGDHKPATTQYRPGVDPMPRTIEPPDQGRRAKSGWNAYLGAGAFVSDKAYTTTTGRKSNVATIEWIEVGTELRRKGLGTAMLELARRESPIPIEHSDMLTPADQGGGKPFAEVVKYAPGQARDDHGRWSHGFSSPLGDHEVGALHDYVIDSYRTNNALRTGKGEAHRQAELDSAMAKASLPEKALVVRVAENKELYDKIANRQGGTITITDKGYQSTTRVAGYDYDKQSLLEQYAPAAEASGNMDGILLLEIEVPKGTRAIDIGDGFADSYADQAEVLLDRGTSLRVFASRRMKNGAIKAQAEVSGQSVAKYAPGQARDQRGRFASGGGGGLLNPNGKLTKYDTGVPSVTDVVVAAREKQSVERLGADYMRQTAQDMQEYVDDRQPRIRVMADDLDKIVRDGRLKNTFETGTAQGAKLDDGTASSYLEGRAWSEHALFGLPGEKALFYPRDQGPWGDPKDRPIYGYFSNGTPKEEASLEFFGDTTLRLKDSVRGRTTVTWDDSYAASGKVDAVPATKVTTEALNYDWNTWDTRPRSALELAVNAQNPVQASVARAQELYYVEAQYHGGITLDDIAQINLPEDATELPKSVYANLGKAGFTYDPESMSFTRKGQ